MTQFFLKMCQQLANIFYEILKSFARILTAIFSLFFKRKDNQTERQQSRKTDKKEVKRKEVEKMSKIYQDYSFNIARNPRNPAYQPAYVKAYINYRVGKSKTGVFGFQKNIDPILFEKLSRYTDEQLLEHLSTKTEKELFTEIKENFTKTNKAIMEAKNESNNETEKAQQSLNYR